MLDPERARVLLEEVMTVFQEKFPDAMCVLIVYPPGVQIGHTLANVTTEAETAWLIETAARSFDAKSPQSDNERTH